MSPVLKLAVAGSSVAALILAALPSEAHATEALSPQVKTQVLNLVAARDMDNGHCIPVKRMSDLVGSHLQKAQQIVEFASANLASQRNLLKDDCSCPTDLAAVGVRVVPHLAGPLRRVLEDRYPECDSAVATAMEQSLGEIAPGAGLATQPSDPTSLGSSPSDEACRDASTPGCGAIQSASTSGGVPGGAAGGAAVIGTDPASDLPPDLQAEILEALEANPERENQCIAANAFSALVTENPGYALAIMEFADIKVSSKGRLLGDECVCPIELATATVDAVPELAVPVRRALDDRYPECTEPGAGNRQRFRPFDDDDARDPEPPCPDYASPSC